MAYVVIYDSRRFVRSDSTDATIVLPISAGGTGNTTGTATVNANLTGPITSVGNATSVASQTGTGSKFVMSVAPAITGAATIDSPTFAIDATNHRVGIGTTSPNQALDLRGIANVDTAIQITKTGSDTFGSGPYLAFYDAVAVTRGWGVQLSAGNHLGFSYYNGSAFSLKFTIDNSGNIHVLGVPVFANNAAAVAGGLAVGSFYRTGGDPDLICVVH